MVLTTKGDKVFVKTIILLSLGNKTATQGQIKSVLKFQLFD